MGGQSETNVFRRQCHIAIVMTYAQCACVTCGIDKTTIACTVLGIAANSRVHQEQLSDTWSWYLQKNEFYLLRLKSKKVWLMGCHPYHRDLPLKYFACWSRLYR